MDWEGERVPKINEIWMLELMKIHWTIGGFWAHNRGKSWKKCSQKRFFLSLHFLIDFGRVWEGFWEGFGGSWPLFGHFVAFFFSACIRNALQTVSWRLLGLEAPGLGFWEGLEGPKLQFSWIAFFDFVFWLLVLLKGFGSKTRCLKIAWDARYRRR